MRFPGIPAGALRSSGPTSQTEGHGPSASLNHRRLSQRNRTLASFTSPASLIRQVIRRPSRLSPTRTAAIKISA